MTEYENIVRRASRIYFWPGAEREDVEQEARVALLRARPENPVLAKVVVHRCLIEHVRRETRRKPQFAPLADVHASPHSVEEVVEQRDAVRRVVSTHLSAVERRAVLRLLNGEPYAHDKSLDNALQRARRKFREAA